MESKLAREYVLEDSTRVESEDVLLGRRWADVSEAGENVYRTASARSIFGWTEGRTLG